LIALNMENNVSSKSSYQNQVTISKGNSVK